MNKMEERALSFVVEEIERIEKYKNGKHTTEMFLEENELSRDAILFCLFKIGCCVKNNGHHLKRFLIPWDDFLFFCDCIESPDDALEKMNNFEMLNIFECIKLMYKEG